MQLMGIASLHPYYVLESQIGIAAHPSRPPLRDLLRMRSNLLKHNNLMLRSERRERLEAWAASDSPISHSQYRSVHAGMRTGKDSMPRTKLEYTRFGSPTTSMLSKRFSISCHTIFSCSSASRMPTQRWMPKPNDRWVRGRARSMMNW